MFRAESLNDPAGAARRKVRKERPHVGLRHDISWLTQKTLHYSLNPAQESGGNEPLSFPQASFEPDSRERRPETIV